MEMEEKQVDRQSVGNFGISVRNRCLALGYQVLFVQIENVLLLFIFVFCAVDLVKSSHHDSSRSRMRRGVPSMVLSSSS